MTQRRRIFGRALRAAFGVLGVGFLLVTFARTWDGSVAELAITPWRLVVGTALAGAGLYCGFRGWATLIGGGNRRALAWGFYYSQLGKYIPGGVWQAVGQVGYTARAQVSMPRAATAFAVFAVTQAVAGAVLGATVGVWPDVPAPWNPAALGAVLLAVFLHRRWMVRAVGLVRRVGDYGGAEGLVPPQRSILVACAWSAGTILLTAFAFIVMLGGLAPATPPSATSAMALAWTIGFLALPVPSGIAVREAVLIGVLGSAVGTPIIIVAAVYHRLVTICAEGVMILGTRWLIRARTTGMGPEATTR